MKPSERLAICVGAGCLCALALFPPFHRFVDLSSQRDDQEVRLAWIFATPETPMYSRWSVSSSRLLGLEIAIIALAGATVIVLGGGGRGGRMRTRMIAVVGALGIVALSLFPPHRRHEVDQERQTAREVVTFEWVFADQVEGGAAVDSGRLLGLQLGLAALTVAVALLLTASRGNKGEEPPVGTFD
jgi:hypothetical protein